MPWNRWAQYDDGWDEAALQIDEANTTHIILNEIAFGLFSFSPYLGKNGNLFKMLTLKPFTFKSNNF